MNKYSFFLSILATAFLSACNDHSHDILKTDFKVTYRATYDGQTLEKNKEYTYGDYPLQFTRYRLYLSDITLLNGNAETRLSDVEYLDFTPENAASASPVVTYHSVPDGHYTGIRIGYGVNSVNNAKQPSNFPAGSPLSVEEDYWSGWKSYIFSLLDGKADPDKDGVKNLAFSYHCGSDAVYKEFTFDTPIHVEQGSAATIAIDLKKLFTQADGSLYDIEANPLSSNSVSDVRVANDIMKGYQGATSISQ